MYEHWLTSSSWLMAQQPWWRAACLGGPSSVDGKTPEQRGSWDSVAQSWWAAGLLRLSGDEDCVSRFSITFVSVASSTFSGEELHRNKCYCSPLCSSLEYNCFTMLCEFLPYSKVNLLCEYMYLPLLNFPSSSPPNPTLPGHHRAPSSAPCATPLALTSYLFYTW